MKFTKKNDIYVIDNKHILLCGDSTVLSSYVKILKGDTKDMLLYTDPPYNASFNGRSGDFDIIKNDKLDDELFILFIKKWYNCIKVFKFDGMYIFCNNYLKHIIENLDPNRWIIRNKKPIIWVKNNFGMGRNYRPKYEMLLFDGKIDNDILNACDVWEIKKDNGSKYIHPTQKPIDCFLNGIKNHKNIKKILDPFAGSGTSLIASEISNKIWRGIELDENYCDKIIRRYYDYFLTDNIILYRDGLCYDFKYLKRELNLLKRATDKGIVNIEQDRLF